MSLSNIPSSAVANTATLPLAPVATPSLRRDDSLSNKSFDRFQRQQTKPTLNFTPGQRLWHIAISPMLSLKMRKIPAPIGTGESTSDRIMMYNTVSAKLDRQGRAQLKTLLEQGVLANAQTDDQHSALYHLYAMATTRRGTGFDQATILKETVEILSHPYEITQKFAPLSPQSAQELMQIRNNPGLKRGNTPLPTNPVTWDDLNVTSSATCVASSVMYYMADKKPGELVRHLSELTSPMNAFFEKARLDELSPDNPQQATALLKENGIQYFYSGPGEVTIKVENPPAGVVRAKDSQNGKGTHLRQYRNGIESAYQAALTHLATRSYDPATDLRDNTTDARDANTPAETSKGLTEAEKTLMETIIKDNGGVQSITYQSVAGKSNPQPQEEGNAYLYGYTRSFEQTAADLIEALKMGEFVIIGITSTDQDGAIVGGHEITITSAFVDKSDGELKFVVADSDDGVPSLVVRTARELIPRIHHAGLPLQLARKINQEISKNTGYLVPDQNDASHFTLLSRNPEPMPAEEAATTEQQPGPTATAVAPSQATTTPATPISTASASTSAQPVIDWVPVYSYAPSYPGTQTSAYSAYNGPTPSAYPSFTAPYAPVIYSVPPNTSTYVTYPMGNGAVLAQPTTPNVTWVPQTRPGLMPSFLPAIVPASAYATPAIPTANTPFAAPIQAQATRQT